MDRNVISRRRTRRLAPLGAACAAVVLITGSGLAQSPAASPVPDASASPSTGTTASCDLRVRGVERSQRGSQRRVERRMDRRTGRGWGIGPRQGVQRGGDRRVPGVPGDGGVVIVRTPTVTAITGSVVTLTTPDGWTRDIDTTDVPITRGGIAITLADLTVGARVQVTQARAADGTWSVRGIVVALDTASGRVAATAPDGFTITLRNGTAQIVRVSDSTTWCTLRGRTSSLEALAVGAQVTVQGVRADDGAIDATRVTTSGRRLVRPNVPTPEPVPDTSPPPAA
ncbi:MAG: hypothetical protein KF809_08040 [Chloroflexi bacterium]|nr:hypothetical protein [Chloroflexota bacterium]